MAGEIKFISERISYRKSEDGLSIIITGKIQKSKETLLLTWLLAWTFCGLMVLYAMFFQDLSREEKLFLVIFLSFWVFFEYKITKVFRWRKWGKEYLLISDGKLSIKKAVNDFGKAEEYFLENIKNLKPVEKSATSFFQHLEKSFWVMGDESIQFDYQGKTIKLAMQLEEKEVKSVLKLLTNS